MPDLILCSRQDAIKIGFGDEAKAIELVKCDPQAWDPAFLDDPILWASSDVEVAAYNRYSLSYSADPSVYPMFIRKTAATLTVYYTWKKFASGQAMAEFVKAAKADADADMARLRDSKQGMGGTKRPTARIHGVSDIDMTDGGLFPRMTIRGWMRL